MASDPRMTAEERAHVTRLLEESQSEFFSLVDDIGEAAEHIMMNEAFFLGVVQRALESPADPDWQAKTAGKNELLERVLVDRSQKATAPELLQPRGTGKEEVIRRFRESRARTLEFAGSTQLPLKAHTREHPFPVFRTLNAYQWLLYIPLHNQRHNQQLAAIRKRLA